MPECRRMRPVLGTYVEVMAQGDAANAALDVAFQSLQVSHARWSFHDPDSELSRLNRRPGEWVALSPLTLRLLRLARAMGQASEGRFDCTVGGQLVHEGALPDHGFGPRLLRGAAEDMALGAQAARLCRPVCVTLDGIAKGFAVDLAVRSMQRQGATGGWVNAGGDLRVFGGALMPVQRREANGSFTPLGELRSAALASSRVGPASADFPARLVVPEQVAGEVISVMAAAAWRADALTKVAAALPPHERTAALARLGGHWLAPAPLRQAA